MPLTLNYLKLYDAWRTFHPDVVCDIPPGTFGHRCRYECEHCGPMDEEPGIYEAERQTMWQPAHYEAVCPNCGSIDCGDKGSHRPFKALRRYRLFPYRGHCQHGIDWRERCDDCWAMVPTED